MAKAKTVEDVILGEAKAGNWNDMLAIASVIENRAAKTGLTYEQVVQNQDEFNAYNKSLPPGVGKYRDMARRAIEQVQTAGPVHNATFYATPAAKNGLPKGLSYVTETAGHQFFEDPQNRAIGTAVGYVRPSNDIRNVAGQPPETLYDVSNPPTPSPRPDVGLLSAPATQSRTQSLTGKTRAGFSTYSPNTDLEDRALSKVFDIAAYNPGATRSQMPTSNVVQDVQRAVTRSFGPEYSVGVVSGQEPQGAAPVNSPKNHPAGWAADVDIVGPDGTRIDTTKPEYAGAMREVQKDLAAQGHAIGFGAGYMNKSGLTPGRMHVGSPPGSAAVGWGVTENRNSMEPGLYADLANAKQTGVNLPEMGPSPINSAQARASASVQRGLLGGAPASITGSISMPTQGPKMAAAPVDMAAMASQYGQYRSPTPPTVEQQITAMTPAISMPSALPSFPANVPSAVPVPSPAPRVAPPAPVAPQQVSAPQVSQPVAPPAPSFTAQDVWNGRAQSGVATNGNRNTRNPDGTVSMTSNEFGYTETMNPDGSYKSTTAPGLFGLDAAVNGLFGGIGQQQSRQGIQGPLGAQGIQTNQPTQTGQTRLGGTVRGVGGAVAGGMVGGLLGPIGSLLGSYIGKQLAQGKNPIGGLLSQTPQQTYQRGYTPGLSFPDQPIGNTSQGDLTAFGEAAARGEYGGQAQAAANNPGRGLY